MRRMVLQQDNQLHQCCCRPIDMTANDKIKANELEIITLPPPVEGCCTGTEKEEAQKLIDL